MNSGSEFIGSWVGLELKYVDAPDVSRTGEVSPTARATPRISAVARPGRAVGSTTFQTVSHRPAPSAYDASRSPPGTTPRTTYAARARIGSAMTASASAAASPLDGMPR